MNVDPLLYIQSHYLNTTIFYALDPIDSAKQCEIEIKYQQMNMIGQEPAAYAEAGTWTQGPAHSLVPLYNLLKVL